MYLGVDRLTQFVILYDQSTIRAGLALPARKVLCIIPTGQPIVAGLGEVLPNVFPHANDSAELTSAEKTDGKLPTSEERLDQNRLVWEVRPQVLHSPCQLCSGVDLIKRVDPFRRALRTQLDKQRENEVLGTVHQIADIALVGGDDRKSRIWDTAMIQYGLSPPKKLVTVSTTDTKTSYLRVDLVLAQRHGGGVREGVRDLIGVQQGWDLRFTCGSIEPLGHVEY